MAYDPVRPNQVSDRTLFTYKDAVDHLMDWNGGSPDSIARVDARRACHEALRELVNLHRWSFYNQHGRVTTVAEYSTGTVEYDHTGGANERQLTLTTGTWPTWARYGTVKINNVPYAVASRVSSSIVTLEEENNPGDDVASGTTYSIYREAYPLPPLFTTLLSPLVDTSQSRHLTRVEPQVWLSDRRYSGGSGTPYAFTIMGSRQYHGQDAIWFAPYATEARSYDCVYLRTVRPLVVEEYATGTVSCTASASTLTGSGTTWTSAHKGATVRLSSSSSTAPSQWTGNNPPAEERVITSVASATSITVDSAFSQTLSGVKYTISDPVDVDPQVMLNLFLRIAEFRMATFRHRSDLKNVEAVMMSEIIRAKGADNRWAALRTAGIRPTIGTVEMMLHHPVSGSDVE